MAVQFPSTGGSERGWNGSETERFGGGSQEVRGVKRLPGHQPQGAARKGVFKGGDKKWFKVTYRFTSSVWL